MDYPEISYPVGKALSLNDFKTMDYYVVKNYNLPIELMMENAGLHLARFISDFYTTEQKVTIGVGNGNNGGGGLVAARKLTAWGFEVFLDIFTPITKALPALQLKRAIKYGVQGTLMDQPDIWIDAYLGFSQKLPLSDSLLSTIEKVNKSKAVKISLDLPTGFLGNRDDTYFQADRVLTLAAPKKMLFDLPSNTELYVADIGVPQEVYKKFHADLLPFSEGNILKLKH